MQLSIDQQISIEEFVEDYWQRQPLFIENALAEAEQFISIAQLQALAGSPEVESRLIVGNLDDHQLFDGPFDANDLLALNQSSIDQLTTLLVQSVNLWHNPSAELLANIDFLPRWRLDDIMISLSTEGSGVGAHIDQYDVLLVQLTGSKHWQIGTPNAPVLPIDNPDGLQLINAFEPLLEVTARPGDCLYVPANTAHYGTALDTGMTLSIGFRSARTSELLMLMAEQVQEHDHYIKDVGKARTNQFEITNEDTQLAKQALEQAINDLDANVYAYGCLQTQPKQELLLEPCDADLDELINIPACELTVCIDPAARIAYQLHNQQIIVFCNGEYLLLENQQLPTLQTFLKLKEFNQEDLQLFAQQKLTKLINFVIEVGYLGVK